MAVTLTTPIEIPPQQAETFDKVWFTHLMVSARDCNGDANVDVEMRPYRTVNNVNEFAPVDPIRMHMEGLFTQSEFNPTQIASVSEVLAAATVPQLLGLAQVVLYAALEAKGKEMGKI
jgi:hypothetical protein